MTEIKKLFGTDGIRGKANLFPMTVELAVSLGRAVGKVFRETHPKPRVVVGKDTRLSCYMFENALISGLCSMGVDTLMLGPLPTPGVAFITRAYRADAGIVISASHNPYYDNGIKFFSSDGFKFSKAWERQVEELVARGPDALQEFLPKDNEIGKNTRVNDCDGRYIEFVKATFPRKLSLKNLTIALDCANGAAWRVAPYIFKELDAHVSVCGNSPDGININDGCGALHPELVQKQVIDVKADIGIALDGDADRVILVDENAQIVDGDIMVAICARDMLQKGVLKNNKVVMTIVSNLGLVSALKDLGIEVIFSQVGDRNVIQEMLKSEANLGGEPSGHVIFLDHNTTGDGLMTALQVMSIMTETGSKLSELTASFSKYPQLTLNVHVTSKPPLETLPKVQEVIRQAETTLGAAGRVLVRYSGTENICRVMVEGPKRAMINQLAGSIAQQIKRDIGS